MPPVKRVKTHVVFGLWAIVDAPIDWIDETLGPRGCSENWVSVFSANLETWMACGLI